MKNLEKSLAGDQYLNENKIILIIIINLKGLTCFLLFKGLKILLISFCLLELMIMILFNYIYTNDVIFEFFLNLFSYIISYFIIFINENLYLKYFYFKKAFKNVYCEFTKKFKDLGIKNFIFNGEDQNEGKTIFWKNNNNSIYDPTIRINDNNNLNLKKSLSNNKNLCKIISINNKNEINNLQNDYLNELTKKRNNKDLTHLNNKNSNNNDEYKSSFKEYLPSINKINCDIEKKKFLKTLIEYDQELFFSEIKKDIIMGPYNIPSYTHYSGFKYPYFNESAELSDIRGNKISNLYNYKRINNLFEILETLKIEFQSGMEFDHKYDMKYEENYQKTHFYTKSTSKFNTKPQIVSRLDKLKNKKYSKDSLHKMNINCSINYNIQNNFSESILQTARKNNLSDNPNQNVQSFNEQQNFENSVLNDLIGYSSSKLNIINNYNNNNSKQNSNNLNRANSDLINQDKNIRYDYSKSFKRSNTINIKRDSPFKPNNAYLKHDSKFKNNKWLIPERIYFLKNEIDLSKDKFVYVGKFISYDCLKYLDFLDEQKQGIFDNSNCFLLYKVYIKKIIMKGRVLFDLLIYEDLEYKKIEKPLIKNQFQKIQNFTNRQYESNFIHHISKNDSKINLQDNLLELNKSGGLINLKEFGKLAHEIKTPLNAIIGLINDIIKKNNNSEIQPKLGSVNGLANYLIFLVSELTQYCNNISYHDVQILANKIILKDILKFCFDILNALLLCRNSENSTIGVLKFCEIINYLIIKSDEIRIKQILLNFISNAVKFTKSGSIEISAKIKENLNSVKISIEDTGIGIKKEDLNKLFDENLKIKDNLGMNTFGSGFGLSICKTLCEKLNIKLKFKSNFQVGSKFSIFIPYEKNKTISDSILSKMPSINIIKTHDNDFSLSRSISTKINSNILPLNLNTIINEKNDSLTNLNTFSIISERLSEEKSTKRISSKNLFLRIPSFLNINNDDNSITYNNSFIRELKLSQDVNHELSFRKINSMKNRVSFREKGIRKKKSDFDGFNECCNYFFI